MLLLTPRQIFLDRLDFASQGADTEELQKLSCRQGNIGKYFQLMGSSGRPWVLQGKSWD